MDFTRLFDILDYQHQKYPNKAAFSYKKNGQWIDFSTEDCISNIQRIASHLLKMGVSPSQKVAIVSDNNTPYWNFIDLALQSIGAIPVPIYPTISDREYRYIFKDADIKLCFVSNRRLYEKVKVLQGEIPSLKEIYTFEQEGDLPTLAGYNEAPTAHELQKIKSLQEGIQPEDLVTLIYTSGTTGDPKGVMLSHQNIISNIKATITMIPLDFEKTAFSFLPLCHIFERMVVYTYMACGMSVYYAESMDKIGDNIRHVRPHYFTCVPRILEKLYNQIVEKGRQQNIVFRKIFFWALKVGKRYELGKRFPIGYRLKLWLANLLVFRLWRKRLGGRVEGVAVGAAAMPPKLGMLFSAAGVQIREGYGLTESSPVISFNRFEPGGVQFGTVGIPLPGIEVRLAEDGEILAKGPNVMLGYYNQPALTEQTIDADGWLHTGDVGEFVHKRFLKITDRKKELFKTSGGKYVAPQLVENKLKESPFIEQIMAVGDNRQFVSALVVPNFPNLKAWCEQNGVHYTGAQYMVINPKVIEFYENEIHKLNQELSKTEQVKKYELLFEEWTAENEFLTPTLKLKRKNILAANKKVIEKFYD